MKCHFSEVTPQAEGRVSARIQVARQPSGLKVSAQQTHWRPAALLGQSSRPAHWYASRFLQMGSESESGLRQAPGQARRGAVPGSSLAAQWPERPRVEGPEATA